MKQLMKEVLKLKMNAGLFISAALMCRLVIALFAGEPSIPVDILWQFVGLSLIGTLLQWLAFEEFVIKRLKYIYRNIIFIIPFFLILSAFAYWGKWFDPTQFSYWLVFVGIFIIFYVSISIFFSLFFKATGQKYNERLEQYKANK